MENPERQFGLLSILLTGAAAPIWIYICVALPISPGFGGSPMRYFVPPIALTGTACAIYRLICNKPNSIAVSVLLSPIVAVSALMIAAVFSR